MNDFVNSTEYQKIFSFHSSIPNRLISRESSTVEFKQAFNWNSKAAYARTLAAFANKSGGHLVFGVSNNPRDLVGLQSNNFADLDEAIITQYLNKSFAPEISFEKIVITVNGLSVGVLHVSEAQQKPVVCISNDAELKEAEIYFRYNGRTERIKYPELRTLIDDVKHKEKSAWMEHLRRLTTIGPSNAAILSTLDGRIEGPGGTLVIDEALIPKLRFIAEGSFREQGLPTLRLIGDVTPLPLVVKKGAKTAVRFTDDPSAPAVQITDEEFKQSFPYGYYDLLDLLRARYSDLKQNDQFYKRLKEFRDDPQCAKIKFLDSTDPKSPRKIFYSEKIIAKFDKAYTKRQQAVAVKKA